MNIDASCLLSSPNWNSEDSLCPPTVKSTNCFAGRSAGFTVSLRSLLNACMNFEPGCTGQKTESVIFDVVDRVVLEGISTDPSIPSVVLEQLARHPHSDVRAAVSDNRSTPAHVLQILAADSDPNVRYQLAENPHLPMWVLQGLAEDDHPYVACRAEQTLSRVQAE